VRHASLSNAWPYRRLVTLCDVRAAAPTLDCSNVSLSKSGDGMARCESMVGNWDTFLQQVEQWTREMERFMAHVDEARAATLSSIALVPTTAGLWRPR
jgi:hypothetical protein